MLTLTTTDRPPTLKGRPLTPGTDLARLPRVVCWQCGRVIAKGTIPPLAQGERLVIQCARRDCLQHNEFGGGE
jgi:hypothetical protein